MSKNKKALSRDDRARRTFYWLVLPAFIIFALVIFVPFFLGFFYSPTDLHSMTIADSKLHLFSNSSVLHTYTQIQAPLLNNAE